jgi:apolipoprotein D and lipocalin family protein
MISRALLPALFLLVFPQGIPVPVRPASNVGLQQFAGTYYEIARIHNDPQKPCAGPVAVTYSARSDGGLDAFHQCRKADGSAVQVQGVGRPGMEGELQVRFTARWRFFGRQTWQDYWVLGVGPDYGYAVVGNSSRTSLWILSRLPRMSQLAYRQAVEIAEANGYDIDKLTLTPQEG